MILSGPSGVGKDTVINEWQKRNARVRRVVAYTTRTPRKGEVAGVDYHFVSCKEFLAKATAGEFLEFKEVHGNHYATPLRDLDLMLTEGLVAILKIDVQGALTAMELRPEAMSVFLLPPTNEELERRIRARNADSDEAITRRLINAHEEIALAHHYQHRLVNDSVPDLVETLEKLVS